MMTTKDQAPAHRRTRRVLAVRMLVAKTDWLVGQILWREDGVVWQSPSGEMRPGPTDLARAQRDLRTIAGYRISAKLTLGDSRGWLCRRHTALELAKQLRSCQGVDLQALTRQAHEGDMRAVERLAFLMLAETLCRNSLPVSPSRALTGCAMKADRALRVVIEDGAAYTAWRALAALVLGSIHRACYSGEVRQAPGPGCAYGRRAYRMGLSGGLPEEPALIVALLAEADGLELVDRYLRVTARTDAFHIGAQRLRDLLAEQVQPATVVAFAETAVAGTLSILEVCRGGNVWQSPYLLERRHAAEQRAQRRRQITEDLIEIAADYMASSRDLDTVSLVFRFARATLDLSDLPEPLLRAALAALKVGLHLPPSLQRAGLELLIEERDRLWNRTTYTESTKANRREAALGSWLERCHGLRVWALLDLLRLNGSKEITRDTLRADLLGAMQRSGWCDPDRCRLLIELARETVSLDNLGGADLLCWMIKLFPTAATASQALLPFAQAIGSAPRPQQSMLLNGLFDTLVVSEAEARDILARLAPLLPILLPYACQHLQKEAQFRDLLTGLQQFDLISPALTHAFPGWFLNRMAADPVAREEASVLYAIGMPLVAMLAGGDEALAQRLASALMRHRFRQDVSDLSPILSALRRFPMLRGPLAQLFPQQPHRCIALLKRLAACLTLGQPAHAALETAIAADTTICLCPNADWYRLLRRIPQLSDLAQTYLRARRLLGLSPDLPSGVRRAVERPDRVASELVHLERLSADESDGTGRAARVERLRLLLADPDRLAVETRAEAGKRLAQIAAETMLAAVERQVQLCYRARLVAIVGPSAADLHLTEDLRNAVQLASDIDSNRRLLCRLLRAHLLGERDWRERHPANAAFLASLTGRGVDAAAWLGAHPRRYSCVGAAGERVRFALEQDPLAVLQMGNHFGTCLSYGNYNAFSTVTNACELNKRVIYARDGSGHVVGRQLIGINKEGGLVGFRIYGSLDGEAANRRLRALFRRYAADFAAQCGLTLEDQGEVPRLFAQEWYDDGVVEWSEQGERNARSPHPHSRTGARQAGKDGAATLRRETLLRQDQATQGAEGEQNDLDRHGASILGRLLQQSAAG